MVAPKGQHATETLDDELVEPSDAGFDDADFDDTELGDAELEGGPVDSPEMAAEDELPAWMTKPAPRISSIPSAEAAELMPDDPGSLLPVMTPAAVSSRDSTTASAVGGLSMRIDSLIAATTTYRSVLSDRLTEYADLVNRLNRTQATDLDEFRKANERTVGEIRRTLADSEDTVRAAAGQSEQLITEIGLLSDFVRTHAADSRELIDATDKLGRFVTAALDQFAERVLGELRTLSDGVVPELNTMRSELSMIRESLDALNERTSTTPIREAMDELRSDFSGLRRAVIEWPDLEVARSEIVAMRADLTGMIEAFHGQADPIGPDDVASSVNSALGPQVEGVTTELSALRDQVRDLASQVAVVEAREIPSPIPSGEVSNEAIESLRDEVKALRRRIQVRAPD